MKNTALRIRLITAGIIKPASVAPRKPAHSGIAARQRELHLKGSFQTRNVATLNASEGSINNARSGT